MPAVGGWQYSCLAHDPPYAWTVTAQPSLPAREGIASELGLYEDLPRYLLAGEPWVEYGVIEYRFGRARPDDYRDLIARWGHVSQGDRGTRHGTGGRYSVSAFLARTLAQLGEDGTIAVTFGPATGFWSYNGVILHVSKPPGPGDDRRLSWTAFADGAGLDPMVWPLA